MQKIKVGTQTSTTHYQFQFIEIAISLLLITGLQAEARAEKTHSPLIVEKVIFETAEEPISSMQALSNRESLKHGERSYLEEKWLDKTDFLSGDGVRTHTRGFLSVNRSSFPHSATLITHDNSRADDLFNQAFQSVTAGDNNSAIELFQEALLNYREENNVIGEYKTLEALGYTHFTLREINQSIGSYQAALALSRKISDFSLESSALVSIGQVYVQLGDYDLGIDRLFKALTLSEANNLQNKNEIVQSLTQIGENLLTARFSPQFSLLDAPQHDFEERADSIVEFSIHALNIFRKIEDDDREKRALSEIFSAMLLAERHDEAIDFFQKQIEATHALSNRRTQQGEIYYYLGFFSQQLNKHEEAIAFSQQALSFAKETDNAFNQYLASLSIMQSYLALGLTEKAGEILPVTAKLKNDWRKERGEESSNSSSNSQAPSSLPSTSQLQNNSQNVVEQNPWAPQNTTAGLSSKLAEVGQLAEDAFLSGRYSDAISAGEDFLELARQEKEKEYEAQALNFIGYTYAASEQPETGIEFIIKSLEIDDGFDMMNSDNLLGFSRIIDPWSPLSANGKESNVQMGLNLLQAARLANDTTAELQFLIFVGEHYDALEQHQDAAFMFREVFEKSKIIPQTLIPQRVVEQLVEQYTIIGDYKEALNVLSEINQDGAWTGLVAKLNALLGQFDKATQAYQSLRNRNNVKKYVFELGEVYLEASQYEKAVDLFHTTLGTAGGIDFETSQLLSGLSIAYANLGENEKSLEYAQLAVKCIDYAQYRDSGEETASKALASLSLANAYMLNRQFENAIAHYETTLQAYQKTGDQVREAFALSGLGTVLLEDKQYSASEETLLDAVSLLEKIRAQSVVSDEDKISFFDRQLTTYARLQQSLALQNKIESALEIAERGRSRAFADLLENRKPNHQIESVSAEPPNLASIQEIAKKQDSVLITYSIINTSLEGQILYAWVVKPTGETIFRETPIGGDFSDIADLVAESRESRGIRTRGGFQLATTAEKDHDELRNLYQLLIEPIEDFLPNRPEEKVIFIPQGELFLVPFAALVDDSGNYLIQNHTILTAPSVQVLDLTNQRYEALNAADTTNARNVLAVGNPLMPNVWNPSIDTEQPLTALPAAEQEAKAIAAFFNTEALLKESATEKTVKQRLMHAHVAHFATHGLLEYGIPQDSGVQDVPGAIALTPTEGEDGLLTSSEILDLELQAELVVLSACDTGLGTITGDGVVGLSRSFIAAGASSVIVSLWSVPDAPTAELMTEFYTQMMQGKNKAQSLRQAMLQTMRDHPDPKDWAAFILIGAAN